MRTNQTEDGADQAFSPAKQSTQRAIKPRPPPPRAGTAIKGRKGQGQEDKGQSKTPKSKARSLSPRARRSTGGSGGERSLGKRGSWKVTCTRQGPGGGPTSGEEARGTSSHQSTGGNSLNRSMEWKSRSQTPNDMMFDEEDDGSDNEIYYETDVPTIVMQQRRGKSAEAYEKALRQAKEAAEGVDTAAAFVGVMEEDKRTKSRRSSSIESRLTARERSQSPAPRPRRASSPFMDVGTPGIPEGKTPSRRRTKQEKPKKISKIPGQRAEGGAQTARARAEMYGVLLAAKVRLCVIGVQDPSLLNPRFLSNTFDILDE